MARSASAILILAACATTPASQPATQPVAVAEEATFTLRQGANTLASERFRRTDRMLEVEMAIPNSIRVLYSAELRPDASVARIDVRQFASGAAGDTVPAQLSSGTFEGDSVQLTQGGGAARQTARRATARGVVPYINPSPSTMEQIVRRARAIGGQRVDVPIWVPAGGGLNMTATVEMTAADSAHLTIGMTKVLMRVDGQGRVLGGTIPSQGLTLERGTAGPP